MAAVTRPGLEQSLTLCFVMVIYCGQYIQSGPRQISSTSVSVSYTTQIALHRRVTKQTER